jgi:LCP family protein required for cell wall assembly
MASDVTPGGDADTGRLLGRLTEVVMTVVVPGWTARNRRPVLAFGLLVLGVGVPLAVVAYVVVSRRNWVALSLDAGFLGWLLVAGVVALLTRLAAVGELWLTAGRPLALTRRDLVAVATVLAVCVPLLVGVIEVGRSRAAIEPAFTDAGAAPLFDAAAPLLDAAAPLPTTSLPATVSSTPAARAAGATATSTTVPISTAVTASSVAATTTTSTLPPLPERPRSGVAPELLADVSTILLIGGDAGPGRPGLRTDTMMLLSVHRPSGRAALISVPRDLERILFPPGSALEARFPYGFDDIANAVYPYVSSRRALRAEYDVAGVRSGVVATAHAVGYSLDVTIHDYVLIDMQGFLELIDALGGVTIDVRKEVPMPGNVPGAPTQYPDVIGPGVIEMDGTTALGYVRSRKADTDYQRTRRQRDLLAALATQVSLDDVVFAFGEVADAVGATLRTSLTPDELADILALVGGETAIVESMGLVPPLVRPTRPDYPEMARIVGEVQTALVTGIPSGY